jgi:polyisoprenoid-binding protein YceI
MKACLFLTLLLQYSILSFGQRFVSFESETSFFSSAPLEDIRAINRSAVSAIDFETGEVVFSVPINKFEFQKSLMKEHFNDKYMESEQFPKAFFKGKFKDFKLIEGEQQIETTGLMIIHGVEREIKATGWIDFDGKYIELKSDFVIRPEDYEIDIPKLMWQNIAEEVEVKVRFKYRVYDQDN